jgi:hypothetical protein
MNTELEGNQVIKAIDSVFTKGQKSKFSESFQNSVSKEAQVICEYLGIDLKEKNQAIFWAMLFGMGIQSNSSIDLDAFSMYLNTTVLRVFQFQKDFDALVKRKLVQRQKPTKRRRNTESLNYLNLYVPGDIVFNVVNGEPLPSRRRADMNLYEILDIVYNLFQQRDDGYIDTEELYTELEGLLSENTKLPFVRQIMNYKLPPFEQLILLFVCQQFVEGYQSVDLVRLLKTLLVETQKQLNCRKAWINNKTKLQHHGICDLEMDSQFRNDKAIVLTPKGQELFGADRELFIEQDFPKNKNIIVSSSIVEKKLFFNDKENKQIQNLSNILLPERHEEMIKKMAELRYNSGLCALFHGKPGTGKTESILQIARFTGRDIFKVEISECRSKWYGESEKLIKGIFTNYRKLLDSTKVAPILFFNEIDAIFGTRSSNDSSSTSQTESAIIGILLNELENFPLRGILLSSSNLPQNLDKAFERRFLYKIYFDHPDANTRSLIWKEKLPQLSDSDVGFLSDKYHFTGGQIDNLVKKCQIEFLFGRTVDLNIIEDFCREESLDNNVEKRRIGYLN